MPEVDKDQLEALRIRVETDYLRVEEEYRKAEENHRRAEENYRLDIAAIEHLQSRFFGALSSISTGEYSSLNGLDIKPPATIQPPQPAPAARASEYSFGTGLSSKPPATIQPPQPVSAARANEEWEIFKSIHK